MFAYLIRQSLTRRIFVLCGALVLLVVGLVQMRQVSVDILPEIDRSIASIQTEAGGLTAEGIEGHISFPVGTAVTRVKAVDTARAPASPSRSIVSISVAGGTGLYRTRELI